MCSAFELQAHMVGRTGLEPISSDYQSLILTSCTISPYKKPDGIKFPLNSVRKSTIFGVWFYYGRNAVSLILNGIQAEVITIFFFLPYGPVPKARTWNLAIISRLLLPIELVQDLIYNSIFMLTAIILLANNRLTAICALS